MDARTGTIRREGLEAVMNPCDAVAVETALRVREVLGGLVQPGASGAGTAILDSEATVHVFTMGPLKAAAVVREALAMGADDGCLLSDARFAGADVFATAYTLIQGMRRAGACDLIVCGRQTTDGGTTQVGGTLAELLGVPHIGDVVRLVAADAQGLSLVQAAERELLTLRVAYPCVISVDPALFTPRLPTLRAKLAAGKHDVGMVALEDLADGNEWHYGLKGSPTKVERVYPAPPVARRERIALEPYAAARLILDIAERLAPPRGAYDSPRD